MKVIKTKLLEESIENIGAVGDVEDSLDRIKDKGMEVHVDVNLGLADQVALHKNREEVIDKMMKEKEKETEGVEGKREPEKFSTPSLKKMYLSESLFEDAEEEVEETEEEKVEDKGEVEEDKNKIVIDKYEVSYIPNKKSSRDFGEMDDLYTEIEFYLNPDSATFTYENGKKSRISGAYANGQFSGPNTMEKDGRYFDSIIIRSNIINPHDDIEDTDEVANTDFSLAKFIADKYADKGVFYEEKMYQGVPSIEIWIPEDEEAPHRVIMYKTLKNDKSGKKDDIKEVEQEKEVEVEEPLTEDVKIVEEVWIGDFDAGPQAMITLNKVREEGKLQELDNLINEWYPEGLDEDGLNDVLRFEDKEIFDALGIKQ